MKKFLFLLAFLVVAKLSFGQLTSTGSAGAVNYVGASSGAAPPFINSGVVVVGYKTGVDFKTNATTTIFTVPTGKTFVVNKASFTITAASGPVSVAWAGQIKDSSSGNGMTVSGGDGSATPVVGRSWTLGPSTSTANVTCTAGNSVQLVITTGYTTSTSVTGTVWVFGSYL